MPATARAGSFLRTIPAVSLRPPFDAKLRMVVRQNSRITHGEFENPKFLIFFQFLGELVGEGRAGGFAVDRDLPGRLIVGRDMDLRGWQTFREMLQDLDGIITSVDCRS